MGEKKNYFFPINRMEFKLLEKGTILTKVYQRDPLSPLPLLLVVVGKPEIDIEKYSIF